MRRVLSIVLPFWSVERSVRSLLGRSAVESSRVPGEEEETPNGARAGREQALRAASSVARSGSQRPHEQRAGAGWRHPRTVAATWTSSTGLHRNASDEADPIARRAVSAAPASAMALARIGRPVLIASTRHGVRSVIAACPMAMGYGVRPGMTIAQAKAMCPASFDRPPTGSFDVDDRESCLILEHDPARDAAALRGLAARLLLYVPSVALATATHPGVGSKADASAGARSGEKEAMASPDGAVWGDLTGCERLIAQRYGDEHGFAEALRERLARRGFTARIAIGSTPGLAWACARFGPTSTQIIAPGDEIDALSPLPIEALRLAPADAAALREVQVERIGHLLALDRSELGERLGHGGMRGGQRVGVANVRSGAKPVRSLGASRSGRRAGRGAKKGDTGRSGDVVPTAPDPLQRLDQALGRVAEPLLPVRLMPPSRVIRIFDGPVMDPEVIAMASADLLDRLCRRMRRCERGIVRLRWSADRTNAAPLVVQFDVGAPTRSRGHLWAILQSFVERLGDGDGGGGGRHDRCSDGVGIGFGIESITLAAPRTAPITHEQREHRLLQAKRTAGVGAADGVRATDGTVGRAGGRAGERSSRIASSRLLGSECTDRLIARFGRDAVVRAIPIDAHVPERSFTLVPLGDAPLLLPAARSQHMPCSPRPSWLLPTPEEAVVELAGDCGDVPSGEVSSGEVSSGEVSAERGLAASQPLGRLLWQGRWRQILAMEGWECIDEAWWEEWREGWREEWRDEWRDERPDKRRRDAARQPPRRGEASAHANRHSPEGIDVRAVASIPSPIATALLHDDPSDGPLPPEFEARRRWYCRARCEDGLWLWLFRSSPGAATVRVADSPEPVHRSRWPTATSGELRWWVHGGWH